MKSTLLIGCALLMAACGGGSTAARSDTAAPAATTSSAPGAGSAATSAARTNDTVTLVGCLQGPSQPGATGTAGSPAGDRARARASGIDAGNAQTHGGAASARYVLMNPTVESGGVGANGAGASGGPLVSAGSALELDGVPADAQGSVNKQVRVTGRVDSRPAGASATTGGAPTGGASTRDDVRANSTTIAGDTSNRRVVVETVQVIAQSCAAK